MNEHSLRESFLQLLSHQNDRRKAAEATLSGWESTPGFLLIVLQLISHLSASRDPNDGHVRQSAAVYFKNSIKRRWCPPEDSGVTQISPADGDMIKTHLIELMCSTPPDIQKQLAEAVSIISKYDFPEKWGSLIPQLVEKLASPDLITNKGVMVTANNIMKRFRYDFKTDPLLRVLKICLDGFQAPLLEVYRRNSLAIDAVAGDKQNLLIAMETQRLMTRIFYSLNYQDIPEYFEDHLADWMTEFAKFLQYSNPLLVSTIDSTDPGPIETLQAAIVENLNLYATKYEEEFAPYLGSFTQTVWTLLLSVGAGTQFDILATQAIKFLTSVSSKQMNVALFTDQILKDIVEHIIIRNLTATQDDEDLFEDNPTDYIRKDMEGSDQDTRRRCAIEFVRTLLKFFGDKVSQLCNDYIGAMLAQYQASMDWRAKDAALHLVLAVTVMSSSAVVGAGELNPRVNIQDIFASHVLPETRDLDVNARPIVKADAIKLMCVFRSHLPGPFLLQLLPDVIRHLSSEHVVIQTYAAMCIEKFLSIKDRDPATGVSSPRITKDHVSPVMVPLFTGLFAVLDNPDVPENDYVMKCMMRTLVVLDHESQHLVATVLPKLTTALARVCKNPANPHFNHYLFECLALFIRSTCAVANPEASAAACSQFEEFLSPHFIAVLSQNVEDFFPYVFQIYAQLLSARPPASGLSETYRTLFPMLLQPPLWISKGNVPALTDLMRAYTRVGMAEIVSGGHLEGLLGVFQKLLSAKASEQSAFKLLESLFAYNPLPVLAPYLNAIFNMLLMRMQEQMKASKTPRYCSLFIHAIMTFATIYGAQTLYESLEQAMPGLMATVITQIWSFNRANCAGMDSHEVKQLIVGATKVLCETPIATMPEVWGLHLKAIASLLGANPQDHVEVDDTFLLTETADDREFDSAYSRLAYAQVPEAALPPEAAAAPAYFATSLAALTRLRPGQYPALIQQVLDGSELAVVQEALRAAGAVLA